MFTCTCILQCEIHNYDYFTKILRVRQTMASTHTKSRIHCFRRSSNHLLTTSQISWLLKGNVQFSLVLNVFWKVLLVTLCNSFLVWRHNYLQNLWLIVLIDSTDRPIHQMISVGEIRIANMFIFICRNITIKLLFFHLKQQFLYQFQSVTWL
jgi:hypothetical protein